MNHLDSMATLRKLIEFYVAEHNETMPHSAFDGQTPDEMYFGRGVSVPDELAERRRDARRRRVEQNQRVSCSTCPRHSEETDQEVAA
jgi:putative transposase